MPDRSRLIIHKTADPRIFFAGGDLFSEECISRFDGLLGFVHGGFSPLHSAAGFAYSQGLIQCPHILHGLAPMDNKPSYSRLGHIIRRDLDTLSSQGCRRIGFIGAETDVSYAESAKECIRTVVKWMDVNPSALDSVTFVVDDDDYYYRFGMDPFQSGKFIYNPCPTDFECWFENGFPGELEELFQVYRDSWPPYEADDIILTDENCPLPLNDNLFLPSTGFSVAVFFTVLLPQLIAKTSGNIDGISAFAKCAGWPVFHRLMAGFISPYAVLKETGLLPSPDQIEEWISLAEKESGYFISILNTLITGRIFVRPTPEAAFLSALNSRFKGEIRNNLHSYLCEVASYLRGNGPEPEWDYVKESELAQSTR